MRRRLLAGIVLGLALILAAPMLRAQDAGREEAAAHLRRSPTRVDFDERLVQGQTKKAEALYLFERKDSEIRSMVFRRKSFRKEIVRKLDE